MGKGPSYRSIVYKSHLHHGLEDAILYSLLDVSGLDALEEVLVQLLGFVAAQGTVKVRLAALLGRC